MKRIRLICLGLVSLAMVIVVCFALAHVEPTQGLSLSLGASAPEIVVQRNSIWFNDTDYNSTTAFQEPDLGNTTQNVTARMIFEYGDYALQQSMSVPTGVPAVFPIREIIEYADESFQISTQRPGITIPSVGSRIIFEYADYATTTATSSYLGPPPYPNDTTSAPSIIVTREPSGPNVTEDQSVSVSANVSDAYSGVENATLQYTTDNSTNWASAQAVLMSLNLTQKPQNSLALSFNATIPGQSSGTRVRFRIIAYNFAGNSTEEDGVIDTTTYLVVPEFPSAALLSLFVIVTLGAVVVYKRKHST